VNPGGTLRGKLVREFEVPTALSPKEGKGQKKKPVRNVLPGFHRGGGDPSEHCDMAMWQGAPSRITQKKVMVGQDEDKRVRAKFRLKNNSRRS